MTTLAAFSARTGIHEAAISRALSATAPRDDAPWYMQAVLGIGAWVTAIAVLFFVGAVMKLVFEIDEPNLVVAIFGALLFAASFWLLHRRPDGAFSAHTAVAFATAGTLLAAAGIGMPQDSLSAATLATLPFVAAAIWQQRSQLLQFLIVSAGLVLAVTAIWDHWDHMIADLPVLTIPPGVALLMYPPRRDVRPAAFALLLVPLTMEIIAFNFDESWMLLRGWPAKIVFLAVFGSLAAINWRRLDDPRKQGVALAGTVGAVAATLLLPTGSSAALILLLLAYTLGVRSLAVLGALAEVYFIWRFYNDLQGTLLIKSIILMSAGAVLLACYGLLNLSMRDRRQP